MLSQEDFHLAVTIQLLRSMRYGAEYSMTSFDALMKIWCCTGKGNPDGIVIRLVGVRVTDLSHDNGVVTRDEYVVTSAILGWLCLLVPGVVFFVVVGKGRWHLENCAGQ